jgi:hypothetical protein
MNSADLKADAIRASNSQSTALTVLYVPYSFDSGSEKGPCCVTEAPVVVQLTACHFLST